MMTTQEKTRLHQAIELLVRMARELAADLGEEVEAVLAAAASEEVDPEEEWTLLVTAVEAIRRGAESRGDEATLRELAGETDEVVARIIGGKPPRRTAATAAQTPRLELREHNGITPGPVQPTPMFQGRPVPMRQGFLRTRDVRLWDENDRLNIHLKQFEETYGRKPEDQELLDILLSRMDLPGIPDDGKQDQFEIVQLARSISQNGIRKPPIVGLDGRLLDGNRRLAAARYALESDEFDAEQKRRVEHAFVWQLTEHATEDDERAVVVSLNFESDCKQDWPEYVKARKVFEDWEATLALEAKDPGPRRQAELKRELSKKYALGPDATTVNRYLKMVDWANDFEVYHRGHQRRDAYEVQHRANHYFQYFDELAKGAKPGGVAYALGQDDAFKHLVFDLLYDGKFRNWNQIRQLRYVPDNQEAVEALVKARREEDLEQAQEHVEDAMTIARAERAEQRELGVNSRIRSFVEWLEKLPLRTFRDEVEPANLERLLGALELVQRQAKSVLEGASS